VGIGKIMKYVNVTLGFRLRKFLGYVVAGYNQAWKSRFPKMEAWSAVAKAINDGIQMAIIREDARYKNSLELKQEKFWALASATLVSAEENGLDFFDAMEIMLSIRNNEMILELHSEAN
jgi:hypothetical protein